MKPYFFLPFLVTLTVIFSCSDAQVKKDTYLLTPTELSDKIKEPGPVNILDVRTPEEYSNGHLVNARNIDWNGDDFEKQVSLLDKSQPVFVYCLSGGRSSAAAGKMRSMGFSKVYELHGGILKWRKDGLPETTVATTKPAGMSRQDFDSLLVSDQLILVDFYAPWCSPCKKMKPYLDELGEEMKDKVTIFRINADDHQSLFRDLKLETIPTLLLYRNKKLIWSYSGYISKEEISKQLK